MFTIRNPPTTLEDYESLRGMTSKELRTAGCGCWVVGRWLFPVEWYSYIPAGLAVEDINGNTEIFEPGVTSYAVRFGHYLAYGFVERRFFLNCKNDRRGAVLATREKHEVS